MSKTVQAVMANLTFTVGQLEEIKSNINDTLRYIKNNQETWDTTDDSKNESAVEESETKE
jgi:hypothetical protein